MEANLKSQIENLKDTLRYRDIRLEKAEDKINELGNKFDICRTIAWLLFVACITLTLIIFLWNTLN